MIEDQVRSKILFFLPHCKLVLGSQGALPLNRAIVVVWIKYSRRIRYSKIIYPLQDAQFMSLICLQTDDREQKLFQ